MIARNGVLIAVIFTFSASCSSQDFGPLAVSRDYLGGDQARTEGIVRISRQCVLLEVGPEQRVLLVWPAAYTSWDSPNEKIRFQRRNGQVVEFADGDGIELGGSGRDSIQWESFIASVQWSNPPKASCAEPSTWSIGDAAHL